MSRNEFRYDQFSKWSTPSSSDCNVATWSATYSKLGNNAVLWWQRTWLTASKLFQVRTKKGRWDEAQFGVKQERSHGEQRVTQNTDRSVRLPVRLAVVSRQTLFHLHLPFVCTVRSVYFFSNVKFLITNCYRTSRSYTALVFDYFGIARYSADTSWSCCTVSANRTEPDCTYLTSDGLLIFSSPARLLVTLDGSLISGYCTLLGPVIAVSLLIFANTPTCT